MGASAGPAGSAAPEPPAYVQRAALPANSRPTEAPPARALRIPARSSVGARLAARWRLGTATAGRRRPGGAADCAKAAPGAGLRAAENAGLIGAQRPPAPFNGQLALAQQGPAAR